MNQSDDSQPGTHPQITNKPFKRSVVRLLQRLGCHNATPGQEELVLGTANTPNRPHPHRQLDVPNSTFSPFLTTSETFMLTHFHSGALQGRSEAANIMTHRLHPQRRLDVLDSIISPLPTTPETSRLTANDTRRVPHHHSGTLQGRNGAAYGREAFYSQPNSSTASTSTRGSHAQNRLDMFHSASFSRPEISSIVGLEQRQRSHNLAADDHTRNHSGSSWPATQDAGPSSTDCNAFYEVQPQHQGGRAAFNNRKTSMNRFEKSTSARMIDETPHQGLSSRIRGSHVQHPLAIHVHGQKGSKPTIPVIETRESHVQHRLDLSVTGQEGPEPVAANTGTPESVATADVKQTNAFFQNAHGFNISGNPSFHNQSIGGVTNVYGGGTDGLEILKPFVSFDAQFDSSAQDPQRQCHPGTRRNVLRRLQDWANNPNSVERIFWLYGPAGAGKSAIAQTIAHSYDRPKVAATFFFFRSDVNRNNGDRLFTTLAHQLAFSMPAIRIHIANSLSERPDLPRTGVETQFNQLLARPFQILDEDATQQLAPAVHVIIDIAKKYQELAPVIIIDGIDECTDEDLQRRFLKVIGDAVADHRFPLGFLIVSRPELHIEQTIRRFQTPIRSIDLANVDDANRDIEKYLVNEFSRIRSEQGLDPTWPGQEIIDDIIYKSSGNFILPSVIIRFVGDPDNFAETQLDIVRNMKPPTTMTPFAVLDQLFLEILRRVPDQDFLKRYLALLTARIAVSKNYGQLYKDDAMLMHVCEKELHAKLRKMRSLLRLEDCIDVHHRSFIDFLHDPSRSNQYYIPKGDIRRYVEVSVDSLVRYVSSMIEQPDHRNIPHFRPTLRTMIQYSPPKIVLSANEWQEVIQPLLDLQDNLLQFPNWHLLYCNKCTVFHLLRELLHLGLHHGMFQEGLNDASVQSVMNVRKRRGVVSSTKIKTEKNMDVNHLESLLLSLFGHLPEAMEHWSLNEEVIKLMGAILRFDSIDIARRVRFVSDAQKLVDLLVYWIGEKNTLDGIHPDARKAAVLALEIFDRVPIIPLSCFLNGSHYLSPMTWLYDQIPLQILSQTVLVNKILDYRHIIPVLVVEKREDYGLFCSGAEIHHWSIARWRQHSFPSSVTKIQIMLTLAKAIRLLHSLGIAVDCRFDSNGLLLDSDLRPIFRYFCSTLRFPFDKQWDEWFSIEGNIFSFGSLFYEMLSGVDTNPLYFSERYRRTITSNFSSAIPAYAWQLIQRCCAEDPESRPSMAEIVNEMENWKIQ